MAILKTSLEEELLTRQERTVLRTILKASQLAEGMKMLNAVKDVVSSGNPGDERSDLFTDTKHYLVQRMLATLENLRIPNSPDAKAKSSSTQDK